MNNSFVKNLLLLSSVSYDNEVLDEIKAKWGKKRTNRFCYWYFKTGLQVKPLTNDHSGSSITDSPAAAHLENKPNIEKMDFKPAVEIPVKATQCQPGMSGVSILERVFVNDELANTIQIIYWTRRKHVY